MNPEDGLQLGILFVLVFLSAFFSSAETAFSTANQIRLKNLAEEGNRKAIIACKILANYSRMISTILIGNNIVNIVASSLATVLATNIASRIFGDWAVATAIGIATGVLTVVVLLFGEIIPKTWAKLNNEKIALVYSPIVNALCILFTPLVFIIDILSSGILRMLRIDPDKKVIGITESELLSYVDVSHQEGVIESEEKEIIYNLFDFSDALAKDIMIPRVDIVEVDANSTYEEVVAAFQQNMYTRIPVYENTPDNIIGLLNIKDFLFVKDSSNFNLRDIMREVYYTYEYKKIPDLLNEMREKTAAVTIVLNEYGAAEGMITMEDLLEEIVGEIRDEFDEDEKTMLQNVGENQYLIEGSMKLADINDRLETDLSCENYDSIGGIIIEHLDDRLPNEGEEVTLEDGTTLTVKEFENNRIQSVLLVLPEKEEEASEEGDVSENKEDSEESKEENN
ncbi:MAG: HlyC/CorC family transporter [Lachnospiraceae bacterium]|nr:HlyC/CorC family transporter [Lachnospiraceae bacterium]